MDRADHIRQILSARGLTLYRVSRKSAQIFGRSSRFYVPHNLYHDIVDPPFAPTIHQLLAFSHITNYRLTDWMSVFGFDLDAISALGLSIPRRQTILLDSTVYDTHAWIPWFAARLRSGAIPSIAPLGQLLASAEPKRAIDLLAFNERRFLYARVGDADLHALSCFVPGSIVRVDTRHSQDPPPQSESRGEESFFLLEHEFGCICAQLRFLARDRVRLRSPQPSCAHCEFQIGKEVRIRGVIDAEIRPTGEHRECCLPGDPVVRRNPQLIPGSRRQKDLKSVLRDSRVKVGLSFREASLTSRWIAKSLTDESYFAAASTLSDYETLLVPPRHLQKILTLCVLYCIDFQEFLRTSGLPLDKEGREPMPDELARRLVPSQAGKHGFMDHKPVPAGHAGLLDQLVKRWQEVPLFLRHSIGHLTGFKNLSLSDVFWVGGNKAPTHPLLINADLVAVNRRVKKPPPSRSNALSKRPLYVILTRNGGYLCGSCILDHGNLIMDSYAGEPASAGQFKNGVDAEVVGQVTAIARRLAGPRAGEIPAITSSN